VQHKDRNAEERSRQYENEKRFLPRARRNRRELCDRRERIFRRNRNRYIRITFETRPFSAITNEHAFQT